MIGKIVVDVGLRKEVRVILNDDRKRVDFYRRIAYLFPGLEMTEIPGPVPGTIQFKIGPREPAAPSVPPPHPHQYDTEDPNDPNLGHGSDSVPVPQNKAYLVLSEEERAKGFVRPLRWSYIHVGHLPEYPLRDLTDEERERYGDLDYVKFEKYPESLAPVAGRYWTAADLAKRGCGTVTSMSQAICETYARNPKFYGSTYCCGCHMHLPVAEFKWIEADGSTGPTVGS